MRLVVLLLVLLLLSGSIHSLDGQTDPRREPTPQATSQRDEKALAEYLRSTLAPDGAARVYFHTTCGTGQENPVPFPAIGLRRPADGERGIEAVRGIFRGDKDVTVTEAHSGIVRITIGHVYTRILDTRLPSLRLTQVAQYNPNGPAGAIIAIENSKAVRAAMRKLRVRQASLFYEGLESPPLEKLPHLPSLMKSATMDQVLDSVARTFHGVVSYGECSTPGGGHLVDMWFSWFDTGE